MIPKKETCEKRERASQMENAGFCATWRPSILPCCATETRVRWGIGNDEHAPPRKLISPKVRCAVLCDDGSQRPLLLLLLCCCCGCHALHTGTIYSFLTQSTISTKPQCHLIRNFLFLSLCVRGIAPPRGKNQRKTCTTSLGAILLALPRHYSHQEPPAWCYRFCSATKKEGKKRNPFPLVIILLLSACRTKEKKTGRHVALVVPAASYLEAWFL